MANQETSEPRKKGKPLLEFVTDEVSKERVVDLNYEFPKFKVKEEEHSGAVYRCCSCGVTYRTQEHNFYLGGVSSLWKGNNGYLPFCKTCVDEMFRRYTKLYCGNEEHALKHLCTMFDWFYSPVASSMAIVPGGGMDQHIQNYPSKMLLATVLKTGKRLSIRFAMSRQHMTSRQDGRR